MAVLSGFFNSIGNDRLYDAAFFADYFASFIGNGVYPEPASNLQVVEHSNMQTKITAGKGWINGYYVNNTSDLILTHDIADGVLKRIDRVVMQLNYLTRQITFVVKKGANASSPTAPLIERNSDVFELVLADVLINNGQTSITQMYITDQRLNGTLCGVVHGTIKQVDPTAIFNQYQSWFVEQQKTYQNDFISWSQMSKSQFDMWFKDVQSVMDDNVATQLLARVTTLESRNQVVYDGSNVKLIY